jgi:hypothetical protein
VDVARRLSRAVTRWHLGCIDDNGRRRHRRGWTSGLNTGAEAGALCGAPPAPALAEELGIEVTKDTRIGWSPTAIPVATREAYAATIEQLGRVLRLFRLVEISGGGKASKPTPPVMSECGRKIRVSQGVLAEAPIVCGACGTEFTLRDPEDDGDQGGGRDGAGVAGPATRRGRERVGWAGPARGALPEARRGGAAQLVGAARLPPSRDRRRRRSDGLLRRGWGTRTGCSAGRRPSPVAGG